MDQRKNDRPRRRLRWLGLPESLRDRLLARMLAEAREDERRGRVPPSDLTSARLARQPRVRLITGPGGVA